MAKGNTMSIDQVGAHAKGLGFTTWEGYYNWCSKNGFSAATRKTNKKLKEEERTFRAFRADSILKKYKKDKTKNFLQNLAEGYIAPNIPSHIKQAYESVWSENRQTYVSLLIHLYKVSKLLKNTEYYAPIAKLMMYKMQWVRSFEDWKPHSHNLHKQFSELTRYLLCKYDIPRFMDTAWFDTKDHGCSIVSGIGNWGPMDWFVEMGSGTNIRKCPSLPVPLTKKMAHNFTQAPSDANIKDAFLWAQITAEGGDERLFRALLSTRLNDSFKNNEFRLQVMRFFANNPMIDTDQIGPIIDYIRDQKYRLRREAVRPGVVETLAPAQPNFSMAGRSVQSLLAQMERWHRQLGKEKKGGKVEWEHSTIPNFEHVEGKPPKERVWTITELLSSGELNSEGRAMKHCVSSYAHSCAHGSCSIWTLERRQYGSIEKLITIELRKDTISQLRGKLNRLPNAVESRIINLWASKEGLKISKYLSYL